MVESQDFVSPERFQFDTDGTSDFTRTLDRSQDSLGRDTGWDLKATTTTENSIAYDYSSPNYLQGKGLADNTGHFCLIVPFTNYENSEIEGLWCRRECRLPLHDSHGEW